MSWRDSLTPTAIVRCDPGAGQPENIFLPVRQVVRAAKALLREGYFLEDLTGVDVAEGLQVLYHFDHMARPGRITLRVLVPHSAAVLPSLAGVYPGAEWHERECMDFFPVTFTGNPNPSRLLLPADMEEKPLAKAEKARASLAALLTWTELEILDGDAPEAAALKARQEALAEAAAKATAKAAAEAAKAEDKGGAEKEG